MTDELYDKSCRRAEELKIGLIAPLGLEEQLDLFFDGEHKDTYDFYKKPDLDTCIYSTGDIEVAKVFVIGFYYGG